MCHLCLRIATSWLWCLVLPRKALRSPDSALPHPPSPLVATQYLWLWLATAPRQNGFPWTSYNFPPGLLPSCLVAGENFPCHLSLTSSSSFKAHLKGHLLQEALGNPVCPLHTHSEFLEQLWVLLSGPMCHSPPRSTAAAVQVPGLLGQSALGYHVGLSRGGTG